MSVNVLTLRELLEKPPCFKRTKSYPASSSAFAGDA